MADRPSISAIIPTHNAGRFLPATLASIAAQSTEIAQLVISDDASDDDTCAIVEDFRLRAKFEVLLLHHQPAGVTANYLHAAQHASSDIILIADHDDVWDSEKVAKTVSAFADQSVQLVCHDSELVDQSLRPLGNTIRGGFSASERVSRIINSADERKNFQYFLRGGLPWLAHTLAFRHELLPLLLDKPVAIDDWWFEEWLSCVAATQGRIHFLPDALIKYRQHANQTSGGFLKADQVDIPQRLVKYQSRLQKMRYCAGLIDPADPTRARLMRQYLAFLEQRQAAIQDPKRFRMSANIGARLLRGEYHGFAHGWQSFFLDFWLSVNPAAGSVGR